MKRNDTLVLTGLSGVGAVLAYVETTLLGAILRPGYSQVSHDISKLTEAGATHRRALALGYAAYNLLLSAFATGTFLSSQRTHLFDLGWGLTLVNCISGLLQVSTLRGDPDSVPMTRVGIGHLVGASVSSLCTVISAFALGLAFRRDRLWRPLSSFSLASGAAIALTGPVAGLSASRRSRLLGLFERVTIGLYLLWVLVVSCYALTVKENDFASQAFLDWFVTEQVGEEKNAQRLIRTLEMTGDRGDALVMLDRELGARTPEFEHAEG